MTDLNTIRRLLDEGMELALQREDVSSISPGGFHIESGADGCYHPYSCRICPIAALLVGRTAQDLNYLIDAANLLGVSQEWVWEFVCGVDNSLSNLKDSDAYQLGQEYRARLLAVETVG